jgi:NADH:ubiquinone oxidoreductase subunit C
MQPDDLFSLVKSKFPDITRDEQSRAVTVPQGSFLSLMSYLKGLDPAFDNLHCLTAVDWKDHVELVYILYSFTARQFLIVKVNLGNEALEIESVESLWRSADWLEREVYDLFGVKFRNHPNLQRILNPDDWQGYPLRKDYTHKDLVRKP